MIGKDTAFDPEQLLPLDSNGNVDALAAPEQRQLLHGFFESAG